MVLEANAARGLIPVIVLGVPPRYKASKLKVSLRIPPYMKGIINCNVFNRSCFNRTLSIYIYFLKLYLEILLIKKLSFFSIIELFQHILSLWKFVNIHPLNSVWPTTSPSTVMGNKFLSIYVFLTSLIIPWKWNHSSSKPCQIHALFFPLLFWKLFLNYITVSKLFVLHFLSLF